MNVSSSSAAIFALDTCIAYNTGTGSIETKRKVSVKTWNGVGQMMKRSNTKTRKGDDIDSPLALFNGGFLVRSLRKKAVKVACRIVTGSRSSRIP